MNNPLYGIKHWWALHVFLAPLWEIITLGAYMDYDEQLFTRFIKLVLFWVHVIAPLFKKES